MEFEFHLTISVEQDRLVGTVKQGFSDSDSTLSGAFTFKDSQKALAFFANLLQNAYLPDEFLVIRHDGTVAKGGE